MLGMIYEWFVYLIGYPSNIHYHYNVKIFLTLTKILQYLVHKYTYVNSNHGFLSMMMLAQIYDTPLLVHVLTI